MNNKSFIESLQKKEPEYMDLFHNLYESVVETNKLIGMDIEEMSKGDRENLIDTYYKLRVEEGKEVKEALDSEDKTNLVQELIDVLVVSGFEFYLENEVLYQSDYPVDYGLIDSLQNVILFSRSEHSVKSTLSNSQNALMDIDCNLKLAIDEVLKANLSKFPTIKELYSAHNDFNLLEGNIASDVIIDLQIELLESGGRYSGVTCEKVIDSKGDQRLVFWSEKEYGKPKRKYLKPVTFIEADLSKIWEV